MLFDSRLYINQLHKLDH